MKLVRKDYLAVVYLAGYDFEKTTWSGDTFGENGY